MFEGMVGYTLIRTSFRSNFCSSVRARLVILERYSSEHRKPYKSADGYICILPYTNQQWASFFTIIGRDDLHRMMSVIHQ